MIYFIQFYYNIIHFIGSSGELLVKVAGLLRYPSPRNRILLWGSRLLVFLLFSIGRIASGKEKKRGCKLEEKRNMGLTELPTRFLKSSSAYFHRNIFRALNNMLLQVKANIPYFLALALFLLSVGRKNNHSAYTCLFHRHIIFI